jgi:DNA polymerase-3 subunit alpha
MNAFGFIGNEEYEERLVEELSVIEPAGFSTYFLVMGDIVRWARDQGIWVGPGRGSGGGSLVSYLLGCTGLDPVAHELFFERFLNPERIAPPDLDIDFQASRREEVIQYAVEKYGQERVARIVTIGTIKAKNALRDSARVLGRPHDVGTRLTWSLPSARAGRMPSLSEADMSKVDDTEVFDLATRLEGLSRSSGVHASGLVISPVPLTEVLPIFVTTKKHGSQVATQFDFKTVEKLGLVKLDPLGLQMGDVILSALQMSNGRLPDGLDDPLTYELLRSGETRAVFQLDSPGMRSLLKRLAPRDFSDIAACIALYRPGPMGVDAHTQYADRRNGREAVSYPHPELRDALSDSLGRTQGVIVYQEQVMSALRTVCGYSLAQADLVRKAMGKKDRELLAAEYEQFHRKGLENGFSEEALASLWAALIPFADYGYNKAHAYGYGMLAYWTAYLKAHYPEAYMAACLTFEGGGEESKSQEFITEAGRMGIAILPPSVNGGLTWTPDGAGGIYYGLTTIKGVGEAAALPIVRNAPYRSWEDYLRRVPQIGLNSGTVRALAASGAFDVLGAREAILSVADTHLIGVTQEREELRKGERGFGRRSFDLPEVAPDWAQRRDDERRLLGTELSAEGLVLKAPSGLTQEHWDYVDRVVRANPGASVVVLIQGSWRLRLPVRCNRDVVRTALRGVGFTEDEG